MSKKISYGTAYPSIEDIISHPAKDIISCQNCIKVILEFVDHLNNNINHSKDVNCSFRQPNYTFSSESILKCVVLLKSEKLFFQVLFLLPEKQKRLIIIALAQLLTKPDFSLMKEEFLHEFSANYIIVTVSKLSKLERNVSHLFFSNIYTVVEMLHVASWNNVLILSLMIRNILGDFKKDQFLKYKNSCCIVRNLDHLTKSIIALKFGCIDHFQYLINDLTFPTLFDKLLKILCVFLQQLKNIQCLEDRTKEALFQALLKCKYFSECEISLRGGEAAKVMFLGVRKYLKEITSINWTNCNYDISQKCNYILTKIVSAIPNLQDNASKDLMMFQLRFTENDDEKLSNAIFCLQNLYCCHRKILEWLLSGEIDLNTAETNIVIDHLAGHIINFGTTDSVGLLIEGLAKEVKSNCQKRGILFCFQQVVFKCLPYFTSEQCNSLLNVRKSCYEPKESCLLSRTLEREQFYSRLNEGLNKLISDDLDFISLDNLSQIIVISPFVALQDIINRIFVGTLNFSVLKGILISMSALYEFDLDTEKKKYPIILLYVKNSFQESTYTKAPQNLLSVINVIIDAVPREIKEEMYHDIFEIFIFPNISLNDTDNFIEMTIVLELIKMLLKEHILFSLDNDLSLCTMLLNFIWDQKKKVFLEHADNTNEIITTIISNMALKLKGTNVERQGFFFESLKNSLVSLPWFASFYFFSLFKNFQYEYQHSLPRCLLRFTKNLDPRLFNLYDNCDGDAISVQDQENQCSAESSDEWSYLYQISYVSTEATSEILNNMEPIDIDEEICNLVEAINPENLTIGKAVAISKCLKYIVASKNRDELSSWFRDDLKNEYVHHPTCFTLLVIIQAFQFYYSELQAAFILRKQIEIQNFLKIFHSYLIQIKAIDDIKCRLAMLMYFFEQLVFNTSSMDESITSSLLLLLMDVIIALANCIEILDDDPCYDNSVVKECHEIIELLSGDARTFLKEKFNSILQG